jgi:hypothetical protein
MRRRLLPMASSPRKKFAAFDPWPASNSVNRERTTAHGAPQLVNADAKFLGSGWHRQKP